MGQLLRNDDDHQAFHHDQMQIKSLCYAARRIHSTLAKSVRFDCRYGKSMHNKPLSPSAILYPEPFHDVSADQVPPFPSQVPPPNHRRPDQVNPHSYIAQNNKPADQMVGAALQMTFSRKMVCSGPGGVKSRWIQSLPNLSDGILQPFPTVSLSHRNYSPDPNQAYPLLCLFFFSAMLNNHP